MTSIATPAVPDDTLPRRPLPVSAPGLDERLRQTPPSEVRETALAVDHLEGLPPLDHRREDVGELLLVATLRLGHVGGEGGGVGLRAWPPEGEGGDDTQPAGRLE